MRYSACYDVEDCKAGLEGKNNYFEEICGKSGKKKGHGSPQARMPSK